MVSLNMKIIPYIYGSHPEALLSTLLEHRSIKIFRIFTEGSQLPSTGYTVMQY